MKTSTEVKKFYKQFIIDSIDCELLEVSEQATDKEKAQAFIKRVESCHRASNLQTVIEHLQGLGEGLSIPYMNWEIIELAHTSGLYERIFNNVKNSKTKNQELRKENTENQIVNDYWKTFASYILQIAN